MNRDGFLRALRKFARKNALPLEVDRTKGKGSHFRVKLGDRITTVQQDLNPGRIDRILKQLGVSRADL